MTEPPAFVIYNSAAGRGRAREQIDDAITWASPGAEVHGTDAVGHGVELAREAVAKGFTRVVAAGGDGTVHEVANGLLQADAPGVRFGVWPIGSSNDYAAALGLEAWWKSRGATPLTAIPVDVGRVAAPGRERFFVNCLGVGFNGLVAIESRSIRLLRGIPLYALAFLKAMAKHFRTPPLAVRIDDADLNRPTLALTINLGQREGGFPITPAAKLDDGRFDYVHVADVKRWELLWNLPGLIVGKLPPDHPKLRAGTCQRVTLQGDAPLCVHADGEFFSVPDEDVREMTVELLPKRLLVEAAITPTGI